MNVKSVSELNLDLAMLAILLFISVMSSYVRPLTISHPRRHKCGDIPSVTNPPDTNLRAFLQSFRDPIRHSSFEQEREHFYGLIEETLDETTLEIPRADIEVMMSITDEMFNGFKSRQWDRDWR
jgi:hypothetical protein